MISFDSSRFHKAKDGGIYLKYEDIETFTEKLIQDYDASLLSNPQAIEYDDFLESYLNVSVTYQDIYTSSSSNIILGCSVFKKQKIAVFNKDKMCKDYINCDPITVVLDNSLVYGNRKVQENITGLHEGGHVCLHRDQFSETEGQISTNTKTGLICCRKSDISNVDQLCNIRPSSAELWREWQANVFAVTIGLPKKSLDLSVKELFLKYGIDTTALIVDADCESEYLAEYIIPEKLKAIYNMSKECIRYRLEKIGFYKTKKKYEEEQMNKQISFFDFIN